MRGNNKTIQIEEVRGFVRKFARKIKIWLGTTGLLAFPMKIVLLAFFSGEVVYYRDPERLKVIALIKKIRNKRKLLMCNIEAFQIFIVVRNTAKVNGDIAEVGVYNGGSAELICEAKGDKVLHLFDTFEGLPDLCEMDDPKQACKGEYLSSFENVKTYLKEYPNVYFYKGLFPSTAESIKNKRFSFVNLDVDLYQSTLSCLEFFYPRMNMGGVIISHDYVQVKGVRKAFDDFFEEKPEPIIELSDSQCLIVKC